MTSTSLRALQTDKALPPDPTVNVEEMAEIEDRNGYSTLEVSHIQPPKPGGRSLSYSEKITDDKKYAQHGNYIEADSHAAPMVNSQSDEGLIVDYDHDSHKEAVVSVAETHFLTSADPGGVAPQSPDQPRILGLKRKTFYIILASLLTALIVAAVGGGVGGWAAGRTKDKQPVNGNTGSTSTNATAPTRYANIGLAAMRWTDPNGTLYKNIYYQDRDNRILESAWDNTTDVTSPWRISAISDAVRPSTPIAAVAGWPHASYNYSLVKNVYYMSAGGELTERQAQANNSQGWEDDNFTGLFSGSNNTYLAAYWGQNIANVSEQLVVLFQRDNFENGITQARYISVNSTSNPWVANNFPFAQEKGAAFAMSLVSYRSGKHLMLYTVGDGGKLGQYEYSINDNEPVESTSVVSITSQSATPLTVDPRAPLAVVAQDNQPLYTENNITLPECYQQTPLTTLIVYATPDRRSLVLSAWNCTAGFEDQTGEIAPLQKPNTTFLALAAMSDRATGDGNIYLMFDAGTGPEVEEWTVPKRVGDPWAISRKVDVDFSM
ncbi:hypothetical protein LTR97_001361 [Elasticomyces elasticus]|uniref:Fucose-specific lectin n=1 Tax=Elasticomyces elasticus TaxID=574655 RepID=A0AAN7ZQE4_9PEZI|nr:hypothetical protein LTR97_001361 [Elasticomyces elasticus]